ncbi:hypothetical protein N431DRAFT_70516 [Stipitochalara longipes BDJ]|nr:hypothetical protein N431DRAFT_70516 [Stipitochalara longipes BDJ]
MRVLLHQAVGRYISALRSAVRGHVCGCRKTIPVRECRSELSEWQEQQKLKLQPFFGRWGVVSLRRPGKVRRLGKSRFLICPRLLRKNGGMARVSTPLGDYGHWTTTLEKHHPILPSSQAQKCIPRAWNPSFVSCIPFALYKVGIFLPRMSTWEEGTASLSSCRLQL